MALLRPRQHSFSTIQERPHQGWDYCMTKAYCKHVPQNPNPPSPQTPLPKLTPPPPHRYPTIAALTIASLLTLLTLYCCLRCLCCHHRRNRSGPGKNPQPAHLFPPLPYQGYHPANMPPPYEGAGYAQFDAPSNGGGMGYRGATAAGGNEDKLPPMPSWGGARMKRVEEGGKGEEEEEGKGGVEMGVLAPPPLSGPASAEPHFAEDKKAESAYASQVPAGYTGPDFIGAVETPVSGLPPPPPSSSQLSSSYQGPGAGGHTGYVGAQQQQYQQQQTAYMPPSPPPLTTTTTTGAGERYTGPDFLGGAGRTTTQAGGLDLGVTGGGGHYVGSSPPLPSPLHGGVQAGRGGGSWRDV